MIYRRVVPKEMAYVQALLRMSERAGEIRCKSDIDYIIDTQNFRGCLIDSLDSKRKIKDIMKSIRSKETSHLGKLKLGSHLFCKMHNVVTLTDKQRSDAITSIQDTVYECSLNGILRLSFTCYKDYTVGYIIAKKLIARGVSNVLITPVYFQILKYALRSPENDNSALTTVILEELEAVFAAEDTSLFVKMEIADIFLLNRVEDRGYEMLHIIREAEAVQQEVQGQYDTFVTIVTDTQNVHASEINTENLKVCVNLIVEYGSDDVDMNDVVLPALALVYPEDPGCLRDVLERVEIDTTIFSLGENKFSLYNLFCALWRFIDFNHQHKEELYKRLVEEMVAMSNYCTTGHLARFISVIQGFTDNEDLHVRISVGEHMKIVIGSILDNTLSTAPDEVVDAIISDDQTLFFRFVERTLTDKLPVLLEDYGDVRSDICSAIVLYTGWKYWIISGEVLKKSDEKID
jgi:hypothetical protein